MVQLQPVGQPVLSMAMLPRFSHTLELPILPSGRNKHSWQPDNLIVHDALGSIHGSSPAHLLMRKARSSCMLIMLCPRELRLATACCIQRYSFKAVAALMAEKQRMLTYYDNHGAALPRM